MAKAKLDAATLRWCARKLGRNAEDDRTTVLQFSGDSYDFGFYSGSASANEHMRKLFLERARALTASKRRPKLTPATTLCGPVPASKRKKAAKKW